MYKKIYRQQYLFPGNFRGPTPTLKRCIIPLQDIHAGEEAPVLEEDWEEGFHCHWRKGGSTLYHLLNCFPLVRVPVRSDDRVNKPLPRNRAKVQGAEKCNKPPVVVENAFQCLHEVECGTGRGDCVKGGREKEVGHSTRVFWYSEVWTPCGNSILFI